MRDALLTRLDTLAGERLEQLVVAHHRRRLTRIGREAVLDAPGGGWAASRPPRAGNHLEVLVDGSEALPRIAEAIESARSSVWLAGWFFTPGFRLRPDREETLRDLLAAAAHADVRVLAWAGAPLPLFHPDRSEVRAAAAELAHGSRVRVALDARERPMHCHHEKLVIVDGETAFVGGIDLTSYAGDRLDTPEHRARGSVGWHDAAALVRGPAVTDVADYFRVRWHEATGESLPAAAPEPAGDVELQLVRTVPEQIYRALPRGELTILESYLRALRSAERLIYLENQFLWSPEIVAVLAERLENAPDGFRLLVVLPMKPNNGADDTRGQLGLLVTADDGRGRLLACALQQRGPGAQPVYVHAKIGIVDDRWLTVGSANLNEHSLFNDTEVNVVTHDTRIARAVRLRLWSEHLERPAEDLGGDPTDLVERLWRPLADEQTARRERGEPPTHRLVRLPHISRRTAGIRGPINGLLVDG
jgi:phosphatidylserine/phosphatidylglycerophosphate/cardiolipin synthase-like enzyme